MSMPSSIAEEVYELHVRGMPAGERRRLLALLVRDLAKPTAEPGVERSVMELHGLGSETWAGIDPDDYVERLRSEWGG
jgi:hypothetical protein